MRHSLLFLALASLLFWTAVGLLIACESSHEGTLTGTVVNRVLVTGDCPTWAFSFSNGMHAYTDELVDLQVGGSYELRWKATTSPFDCPRYSLKLNEAPSEP